MGHQLAHPALAAALTVAVLAGCGGGDATTESTSVLDHARSAAASTTIDPGDADGASVAPPPTGAAIGTADPVPTRSSPPTVAELPPPDPSEFVGSNRVVNLWVGPDGETATIDVWGRRTFTNGPILLAEGIGFGDASEYFAAPPGYSLVVVGEGAGPDGEELAGMFNADEGEQITMIYTNADPDGTVAAPNLWERDPDGDRAPDPPAAGTGLVDLYTANTSAYEDSLTIAIGGTSFYVGDGTGSCRPQRIEEQGFEPNVLGGTQHVRLELAPGPATISLHPWFSPDGCAQPSVLDLEVDVPADEVVSVLVYTPDGETLDALTLPVHREPGT